MKRILYLATPYRSQENDQKETHSTWPPFSEACFSLTPKVSVPKAEQIFMDVGSTQKFFGGENHILAHLEKLCEAFCIKGNIVLTDRPEWAPVFAFGANTFIPPGRSYSHLLKLPIERLQLCGNPFTIESELPERKDITLFMKRVGLNSIRQFIQLTPTAIGRRFGKLGMTLHEWATGTRDLQLPVFEPQELITETIDTEELICLESLFFCLQEVFPRIEARLKGRGLLAQQIKLHLNFDGAQRKIETIHFSEPFQEASVFFTVLKEYLHQLSWKAPLKNLELHISETTPASPGQLSLWEEAENRQADLSKYIQKLRSRYGNTNVGFPKLKENYLPEKSWENVWPPSLGPFTGETYATRPFFLYSPARPYKLTSHTRLIASEHIDTEWWDSTEGDRQYFIAIHSKGPPLWVFWERKQKQWFLQGVFD